MQTGQPTAHGSPTMTAFQVLACPELLPLISAYQRGVFSDMVPFLCLQKLDAATRYQVMSTWLTQQRTLARLSFLVQCIPRSRDAFARYAAEAGRLDVLEFLHAQHKLAFRHGPFYYVYNQVGKAAAANTHLDILQWVCRVWPGWYNPNDRRATQVVALTLAIKAQRMDVAAWLVQHMHVDNNTGGAVRVLIQCHGPMNLLGDVAVARVFKSVLDSSSSPIQEASYLFTHVPCVDDPSSPASHEANQTCLLFAVEKGSIVFFRWLVTSRALDLSILHDILGPDALHTRLSRRQFDVALVLKSLGIDELPTTMTPSLAKDIVLHAIPCDVLAEILVNQEYDAATHIEAVLAMYGRDHVGQLRVANWLLRLLDLQCDRVAVMGDLLKGLAKLDPTPPTFQQLHRLWRLHMPRDIEHVELVCLATGHPNVVACIRISEPMLVRAVKYFSVQAFQSMLLSAKSHDQPQHLDERLMYTAILSTNQTLSWISQVWCIPKEGVAERLLQAGLTLGFDKFNVVLHHIGSTLVSAPTQALLVDFAVVEALQLEFDRRFSVKHVLPAGKLKFVFRRATHKRCNVLRWMAADRPDTFGMMDLLDRDTLQMLETVAATVDPNEDIELRRYFYAHGVKDDVAANMTRLFLSVLARVIPRWLSTYLDDPPIRCDDDDAVRGVMMAWLNQVMARQGGPVAVIGRCLLNRTSPCAKPRVTFRKIYGLWMSMAQDAMDRDVTQVDAIRSNIQHVHGELMYQAIAVRGLNMANWLVRRMDDGQHERAIARARDAALSLHYNEIVLTLNRRLRSPIHVDP
ncbi:hypothetical protein As57867_022195, partial [Aphanomyces stellatus]